MEFVKRHGHGAQSSCMSSETPEIWRRTFSLREAKHKPGIPFFLGSTGNQFLVNLLIVVLKKLSYDEFLGNKFWFLNSSLFDWKLLTANIIMRIRIRMGRVKGQSNLVITSNRTLANKLAYSLLSWPLTLWYLTIGVERINISVRMKVMKCWRPRFNDTTTKFKFQFMNLVNRKICNLVPTRLA